MSKRNLKRSNIRKQQSEKDKFKFVDIQSSQYGKLEAFQHILGTIQHQDFHYHRYIKIPMELIDLAAVFIAGLMSGNDCLLALPSPTLLTSTLESYQANIKFINKTLTRAQITYSSLIVCLWYIDQFFSRRRRRMHSLKSKSGRHLITGNWLIRDLFMASIIVADKYLADLTWTNSDWAEATQYTYSCQNLNQLEGRFLDEMDYSFYVSEHDYYNFCHYLEFRIHLRQFMIGDQPSVMSLSYHSINVLSQHLNPIYVKRLGLSLRPFEAMKLLAKTAVSICIMYTATVITALSITYICYQYSTRVIAILLERKLQEHVVMIVVDMLDITGGVDSFIFALQYRNQSFSLH
ncbi:hypothetical protein BCR42DRAFT_493486 [Absidia repens]|uniref:Cyclin N-terminal domain-containing protein n=1 Tax=Absidia repens TaxID=90262 RepID=A0A1X2IAG3_9FUNG|nr:hypothetical protein BCR42DRAFT_493486 [Absidia repens]